MMQTNFKQFQGHFNTKYQQIINDHRNRNKDDKKEKIVVFCSGCYCPPHEGHYYMMEEAIKYLAQQNYDVVIGIYSVASDAYMQGKIKDIKMNFDERTLQLKKLIKQHKKTIEQEIIVDDFENGKPFIDYPDLCFMYKQEFANQKIKFAYCAGSDLLKYGLDHQFPDFADLLIIQQRDSKKVEECIRKQKNIIVLEHEQTKSLNSSEIRQKIKQANSNQVNELQKK
ncbi:hypothetical protein ABPG72_014915 [Tetrahymena utriculariae]